MEKAEEDFRNAEHTLTLKENCPLNTVCFHAQQCVEKYLKALLVSKGIDFPKTHNIAELVALLPTDIRIPLSAEEQEQLTDYATFTRYTGDWEPATRLEAEISMTVARKARETIKNYLPKGTVENQAK
ncbi:MAG: HEPN domain-containing protein [Candidatus Omnitrophica bacterium]|nr:HEPN domain-containing protein [Candidatus Omnitrophota bacterium]